MCTKQGKRHFAFCIHNVRNTLANLHIFAKAANYCNLAIADATFKDVPQLKK